MIQQVGLLSPGDILHATYRIEALIGVGGTGEVYRAENTASHRRVAIKILKAAYSANERFIDLMRRELLRDVSSDAVVKYFELLRTPEYGGLYFLVMELLEGPSLAEVMAKGPLPPATTLTLARRIAEGLRAAHAAGVLHRDIAPDNILLRGGDPARATLIDFGIAKDLAPDAHTVIGGGFAGKYEYAAPEQLDGRADAQSDLYALGATLLAAARGAAPRLDGDHYTIRRRKDEPVDVSDQPEPLRGVLAQMLQPDRARRIDSAAALERLIAEARPPEEPTAGPRRLPGLGGPAAAATVVPPAPAATPPRRGIGALLSWALAGLALAGGAAAFVLIGPGRALLAPDLPQVDIWRLTAANDDAPRLVGHAPSAEAAGALRAAMALNVDGGPVEERLELASGQPQEGWAEALALLIGALDPLEDWRLDVVGLRAALRGQAADEATRDSVLREAGRIARSAGLTLEAALTALEASPDPALLAAQAEEALSAYRACGPLAIAGIEGSGAPTVTGQVRDAGAAEELRGALTRLFGDRGLAFDVRALNPPVCRAIAMLPNGADGGLAIRYAEGGEPVAGDVFPPDGNPLIDVALPAEAEGYLHVFIVSNEGAVAPLLPHRNRLTHRLSDLGSAGDGERVVRVAYPRAEGSPERLAILFSPPFGDGLNVVVALVADQPLYDPERFTLENVEDFAPELVGGLAEAARRGAEVRHVWRILAVDVGS